MKFSPHVATALLLSAAAAAPAYAALGGDTASVLRDREQLRGALNITPGAPYSIHEITTSSGTTVREYVSAAGKVFGVSWRGPFMPDLHQLLGAYHAQYVQAASAPHAGHRHMDVVLPGLVVHSAGRPRGFVGRAWAPALMPQSVSADDIK